MPYLIIYLLLLTFCIIPQLFAYNLCIRDIPSIITNCSPLSTNAHFYSSLIRNATSHKTDSTGIIARISILKEHVNIDYTQWLSPIISTNVLYISSNKPVDSLHTDAADKDYVEGFRLLSQ